MERNDLPVIPAPLTPMVAEPPAETPLPPAASLTTRGSGAQRALLAAAVSALLLVGGAVAVVSAASPEPSSSTTPSVTVAFSGSDGGSCGRWDQGGLPERRIEWLGRLRRLIGRPGQLGRSGDHAGPEPDRDAAHVDPGAQSGPPRRAASAPATRASAGSAAPG